MTHAYPSRRTSDLNVTNYESGFDAYCLEKDDHWAERRAESGAQPSGREICQHRVGCTGGNGTYHDKRICERKLGNWSGFGEIERALTEVEHFSVISHETQGDIARDLASSSEFTAAADESLDRKSGG